MEDEFLEPSWPEVQASLLSLRSQGYEYLQTYDDSVTWRGTQDENGVPINVLLRLGTFRGNIMTDPSSTSKNGKHAS